MSRQFTFNRNKNIYRKHLWLSIGAFSLALLQVCAGLYFYIANGSIFFQTYLAPGWIIIGLLDNRQYKWCNSNPYIKVDSEIITFYTHFFNRLIIVNKSNISTVIKKGENSFLLKLNDSTSIKINKRLIQLDEYPIFNAFVENGFV